MKRAVVVAGLAFGDEGKGTITDFLTRLHSADLVVRYNGGPQAAHNVVTEDGRHHTFSQFGSGTLAGARTFLSRHMLVEPAALSREMSVLASKGIPTPLHWITIDPDCVLITPWHRCANQLREHARGQARHGSVGLGVGEARADELAGHCVRLRDFRSLEAEPILKAIRDRKLAEMESLATAHRETFARMAAISVDDVLDKWDLLHSIGCAGWPDVAAKSGAVIFEGAQGILLDQTFGFAPYNTWTDCTFANANGLLSECPDAPTTRVGVLRTYFTRHGAGPFVTEIFGESLEEPHNASHPFMGSFRTGRFDAVAARYAIECTGNQVDCLALTHCDRTPSNWICLSYAGGSEPLPQYERFDQVPEAVEQLLGVPIGIRSNGPTAGHKELLVSVALSERGLAWTPR